MQRNILLRNVKLNMKTCLKIRSKKLSTHRGKKKYNQLFALNL